MTPVKTAPAPRPPSQRATIVAARNPSSRFLRVVLQVLDLGGFDLLDSCEASVIQLCIHCANLDESLAAAAPCSSVASIPALAVAPISSANNDGYLFRVD